ncbi:MAG: PAS domain S-box protein [Bryobacteraceae bacterium]|nr:PAS domain S-box protein [Bryobacteraceae bacterium]
MPGGWISAAATAAAVVFVLDLLTPLGIAVPMLYVLPILLSWFVPGRLSTAWAAGSAVVLIWLGTLLSPGVFSSQVFMERTMASTLLLAVAGLLAKQKQLARQTSEAHEARRESESRFQHIFNHAGLGITIKDLDGRFVQCNPAYCALTGYSETELAQRTSQSLIHPDDRDENMRGVQALLRNDMPWFEIENRYVQKSGHSVWVHKLVSVLRAADGLPTHFIVLVTDITERKKIEEVLRTVNETLEELVAERTAELAEANERFEWVTKATHDGVWDWDVVHDTVYFSPRWREMRGFQEADNVELSQKWSGGIHPDHQPQVMATLHAYWKKELPEFWMEYRVRRKDGTIMWVLDRGVAIWDEQGRPIRMVGSEKDITWRKEAEEALRRREHEFHALADNVPALFSYIDRDRRYRFINREYEKFFGRSANEVVGMTMRELLGSEGYDEVLPHLEAALKGHTASFEYSLPGMDASEHWFSAEYVPDVDGQGQVIGLFILLTEITALKQSEAAIREHEAQLQDLNTKLMQAEEHEQQRIARELHDDFTQRLAALTLDLRMVCRELSADSDPSRILRLQQIGDSTEQLAGDLQQMAHRLHPSILEHVGLEAAVREHSDEFAARTGLTVEVLVREVPRDVPPEQVSCLYRVLQESLQNVRKHANATNVLIRLLRTGHGLGLCVHDDGQGFEQAQRGKGRKGLGVTSMKERVNLLNGTFRIRTNPSEGTEVHAWVPLEDVKCETYSGSQDAPVDS